MTDDNNKSDDINSDNIISENKNTETLSGSVMRNGVILGIFALVSTGLIVVTHFLTKDKIAKELELALVRQLTQLVPAESYDNQVYDDCLIISDANLLGSLEPQKAYRMRTSGQPHAVMITSIAPDGYSGNISIALATNSKGKVYGVNILNHQETPGLGDKIERNKSDWLLQFDNLSLDRFSEKQWQVTKDGGDFDSLTGATITSRAIVNAVHKGLVFIDKQGSALFDLDSNCVTDKEVNDD